MTLAGGSGAQGACFRVRGAAHGALGGWRGLGKGQDAAAQPRGSPSEGPREKAPEWQGQGPDAPQKWRELVSSGPRSAARGPRRGAPPPSPRRRSCSVHTRLLRWFPSALRDAVLRLLRSDREGSHRTWGARHESGTNGKGSGAGPSVERGEALPVSGPRSMKARGQPTPLPPPPRLRSSLMTSRARPCRRLRARRDTRRNTGRL